MQLIWRPTCLHVISNMSCHNHVKNVEQKHCRSMEEGEKQRKPVHDGHHWHDLEAVRGSLLAAAIATWTKEKRTALLFSASELHVGVGLNDCSRTGWKFIRGPVS